MSGGHGHDAGPHHAGSHHAAGAHDGGHGHGAGSGVAPSGPHEIPPMPADPFISPARADYEQPWPGRILLWPVVWAAFAGLCFVAARTWNHPVLQGEHGHGVPGGHEAPGATPGLPHETPAMGERVR